MKGRKRLEGFAPQALILCAGRGERLRPLTHFQPKAMVPFLNLPMLCYNWFHLEALHVSSFLINSCLFTKTFSAFAKTLKKPNQRLRILHEDPPLGSGGVLYRQKRALSMGGGCFYYLNGDSLFFPLKKDSLQNFARAGKSWFINLRGRAAKGCCMRRPWRKKKPLKTARFGRTAADL